MRDLPAGSVDCLLTDLPYGTTENKWDGVLPMDRLWPEWRRLLRTPASPVVLFTQQPFTTTVAASNLRNLRTEWIWRKNIPTGFLNARRYPLKAHENILVFADRMPPYFPQKTMGSKPYRAKTSNGGFSTNYGKFTGIRTDCPDGSRFPTTLQEFAMPKGERGLHPTQKPVALLEYLIRTYTAPGATVFDCCAGSGSTLVAAIHTGRAFLGMECDPAYHAAALRRIHEAQQTHERTPAQADRRTRSQGGLPQGSSASRRAAA